MSIGKRIKELRAAHGWSQRELAKRAGINPKIISPYELDQVNPTIGAIRKIAVAFGVTIDSLAFDELSEDAINDKELLELFKKIDKLDIKKKKVIKDIAKITLESSEK